MVYGSLEVDKWIANGMWKVVPTSGTVVSEATVPEDILTTEKGDTLVRLVDKLDQWRYCMSYNDSYFGEPAGLVKSVVKELALLVGTPKEPLKAAVIENVLPESFTFHTKHGDCLCTATKILNENYEVVWGEGIFKAQEILNADCLKSRLDSGEYWLAEPLKLTSKVADDFYAESILPQNASEDFKKAYYEVLGDFVYSMSQIDKIIDDAVGEHTYKYAVDVPGVSTIEPEVSTTDVSNLTVNMHLQINGEPANEYIESLQGKVLTLKEEASEICLPQACSFLNSIKSFTEEYPASVFIDSGKYIVYYRDNEDMFAKTDLELWDVMNSIKCLEKAGKNGK
jgi:uncharacterized protein YozE (UPF0346 family)